jgi:hypothetical protein
MIINLSADARLNLTQPPYDTEGLTAVLLGNKGAGKSNTLAVFSEEAHANHVPFIYFDPNGDAASLRELGDDVVILGNTGHDETIRRADYDLALALRDPGQFIELVLREGYSLVVDLTDPGVGDFSPLDTFTGLVNKHFTMAGRRREPCFVLIDEAHVFAPQSRATKEEAAARRALGRVASDGRKRGMMLVTATQRATYLDKRIIFGANVRIFGKITYFPDYEVVKHYVPASFSQMRALRSGDVYLVTDNNYGKTRVRVRTTTDLGKTPAFNQARGRKQRPSKIKQLQLL